MRHAIPEPTTNAYETNWEDQIIGVGVIKIDCQRNGKAPIRFAAAVAVAVAVMGLPEPAEADHVIAHGHLENAADMIEHTENARVKSVAGGFAVLQFMHPNEAYGKVTIQQELAGDLKKAVPGQRVRVKLLLNRERQITGFTGVEVDDKHLPSEEEFMAFDDSLSTRPRYPDDPSDPEKMKVYREATADYRKRRHEARRKFLIAGEL